MKKIVCILLLVCVVIGVGGMSVFTLVKDVDTVVSDKNSLPEDHIPVKVKATLKKQGEQGELTIDVIEKYSDGSENVTTSTFPVEKNAAADYQVGNYTVHVSTKNNKKILECSLTEARTPDPGLEIGKLAVATMDFGGIERQYYYYIPSTYKAGDRMPLMFTLHGSGLNARSQLQDSRFDKLAEQEGFIVIAPNAVAIHANGKLSSVGNTAYELGVDSTQVRWNAGFYDPQNAKGVDDVGYLSALIDLFVEKGVVNEKRVFSSGLSHGACMSIRLALEIPEKMAGIAPVSGLLFTQYEFDKSLASDELKIVFVHGDKDPVIPIEGISQFALSLDKTIAWFMERYGMSGEPTVKELPFDPSIDSTKIVRYEYPANGSGQIVKYVVENGGHTWPGGTQYVPPAYIGYVSRQQDASVLIWDEFKNISKD